MNQFELNELVQEDFNEFNDIKLLLDSYRHVINQVMDEYKIENLIPVDSIYWTTRSKIIIAQQLFSEGLLPIPESPTNAKETFRMLKYGKGHVFNR